MEQKENKTSVMQRQASGQPAQEVRMNDRAKEAAAVSVQSAIEVKHAEQVRVIGQHIISKTGEVAGLYLTLCRYIRANRLAPKLVSHELTALGFKKSRVSEINRVAQASDKLFNDYEAKMLGFDRTLALARVEIQGQPPVLTPAGKQLSEAGAVSEREENQALRDAASTSAARASGKEKKKKASVVRAALVAKLFDTLHPKCSFPLQWEHGPYKVVVSYDAEWKPAASVAAKDKK